MKKLILLVDTSSSMSDGGKIQRVYSMIEDLSNSTQAFESVSLLTFSDEVKWQFEDLSAAEIAKIQPLSLECRGCTALGRALKELGKKLDKCEVDDVVGIVIVTDGFPTDDWKSALDSVEKSLVFQRAYKSAIALGDDADIEVLARICGDEKLVRKISMEA